MGEHWSDFFLAQVGAAAALAGLLIVAMSINLQRILEFPQLPGRAAEMLIVLVGALLVSSVALVPGQPPKALGVEFAAVGLTMSIAPLAIQVRTIRQVKNQPVTWWLWRGIVAQCASLPIVIGGALLIGDAGGGLYWVAAGVLVTLAATVWNAWILLVEILR